MAISWSNIPDAINNPEAFLDWVSQNIKINRTIKALHSNGDVWPGMAAIIDVDGKAHPYDINNSSHQNKYIGVVEGRDTSGLVRIVTHGVLFNATIADWEIGVPYYIASNSYLTPSAGDNRRYVAVGVDSGRLLIMPSPGTGGSGSGIDEIDGGFANSVYLVDQNTDGGGA